ncbi:putative sodium-dependent multivitamin transporter isoform X1 [Dermacentor variabilis]|uniref:putative sodium-dependent multivitamin transporter isoform X1 n=1 Tax=Dermacentor variabilis TaxID=34621 RepID=UPI003F5C8D8C
MEAEEQRATFGAADYAVFSVMLVVSSLIGIYYRFTGDRQRTAREYLVANKNMSVVPVAFSLMASFMSAVTLLGVPSENYYYGTQFVIINIAYIFGTPIAAYVFLPVFYKLQVISVYEYLERRFGKATRLAMSATFVIQMVLYMAVVLYAPAVALSAVTGISKWLSIISVGLVCTFYCTIGGMKAVLWTDLFQSILMFVSMFAVVGVGTYRMGGVSNVWNEALAGGRIEFLNFDPDPTVRHTVWTLAIGGIFVYVSLYGVNQAQVQRLMTVSTLRKAQLALFLNWPIVSALSLITSSAGIVMYANFRHCDPLLSGKITKTDQVLPYFVMLYLGGVPGLPGLFVAGIFSGALSTVSSAVNSLAAVLLEDFVRPFCISQKTYDKHASLILKVLAFFFGVLCVLLTGLVEQLGGVLQASFMIFGVVGGPLLGVFTLGFLCRRANQEAALSGLVAGLLMGFWIGIGATVYGVKPEGLPLLDDKCPTSLGATSALTTAVSYVSENATTAAVTILAESTVSDNETSVNVIAGERYILPLYRLSYQWYCGFGWLVVIVVGSIVTLLTGGAKDVDPYCLSPLVTKSPSRRQRSWSLDRMRHSSVTSSQIPMTAIKE